MALNMLLAIPLAVMTPSAGSAPFADRVDDAQLAAAVGMGGSTTRLSIFVAEQGATQVQGTGEDQRAAMTTWFADNNVQLFANAVLRGT